MCVKFQFKLFILWFQFAKTIQMYYNIDKPYQLTHYVVSSFFLFDIIIKVSNDSLSSLLVQVILNVVNCISCPAQFSGFNSFTTYNHKSAILCNFNLLLNLNLKLE